VFSSILFLYFFLCYNWQNDYQVWYREVFWEERLWNVETQDRGHLNLTRLCRCSEGESNMPESMSYKEKTNMINKVRSIIILYLGDKALREVAKEKIVVSMRVKLESLYMIKSLAHTLFEASTVFIQNDRLKNDGGVVNEF